jgi:hypothetical protein
MDQARTDEALLKGISGSGVGKAETDRDGGALSFQWRFLMAKKPTEARRKLIEFDAQIWHAPNLLSRESMKTFQELADEEFRDLLQKYGRPTDLKAALRESAKRRKSWTKTMAITKKNSRSALYHRADHAALGDFTAVSGFFACAS